MHHRVLGDAVAALGDQRDKLVLFQWQIAPGLPIGTVAPLGAAGGPPSSHDAWETSARFGRWRTYPLRRWANEQGTRYCDHRVSRFNARRRQTVSPAQGSGAASSADCLYRSRLSSGARRVRAARWAHVVGLAVRVWRCRLPAWRQTSAL